MSENIPKGSANKAARLGMAYALMTQAWAHKGKQELDFDALHAVLLEILTGPDALRDDRIAELSQRVAEAVTVRTRSTVQ